MGQSYRIRTELGVNKTINVQLDQEFEQLEILSLKLQQEDVYDRNCADYGVIVGRVTANNGFGLPNARVSIFIPITNVDESNPIISSIYPYKSPSDKNEDGYRYNLLPYEKSFSAHAATGTLPTRLDALTGGTAVEIFDTYYKYTAKTNDSGDYMIMGVPLGYQTVVMDVDLSDIGEFSLTPQDLIRMGLASESQVAGNRFRTSNDLTSLPQIVNLVKNLEISPLWGDPTICDIAINRLDFDLRDEANIDIQPTSVFMGSIYSTPDRYRIRKNGKPRDDMGNLCSLESGPGQILCVRQTIQQDGSGRPILEQYELEQSGNIIDGDGTWLTELPMNLEYYITNEFGEKVISNDPTIGIPTKGKYRFKIKWTQPASLSEQTKRPYFLVPNIREYGWNNTVSDPNFSINVSTNERLAGSYYFGLDWSGYTNINAAINCDDTFYQFEYNRVYTIAGLIDEFKNGARGRFIGIKEIDNQDCDSTVNRFPVNEGFRNFDVIYFLFSIIMGIFQAIGPILIIIYHLIAYIYNAIVNSDLLKAIFNFKARNFPTIKLPMVTYPECQACDCGTQDSSSYTIVKSPVEGLLSQVSNPTLYVDKLIETTELFTPNFNDAESYAVVMSEAMATYNGNVNNPSVFKVSKSQVLTLSNDDKIISINKNSLPIGERINIFNLKNNYYNGVNRIKVTFAADSNTGYHLDNTLTVLATQDLAPGTLLTFVNPTKSTDVNYLWSGATTAGNIVNGINGKLQTDEFTLNVSYANPTNRFAYSLSTAYTIPANPNVDCVDSITVDVSSLGTITYTKCNNVVTTYDATTLGIQTITDDDCITLSTLGGTSTFNLVNSGDTCQRYLYPSDIEYFQVLTAITITTSTVNGVTVPIVPNASTTNGFFGGVLWQVNNVNNYVAVDVATNTYTNASLNVSGTIPMAYYEGFTEQKILILQRGVDPYSPKLTNKYNIGNLFGTNENDPNWEFTASTRVNVPIQRTPTNSTTLVPQHNIQDNIYFQSNFFTPGIVGSTTPGLQFTAYTTSNVGYYGALDGISSNRVINYTQLYNNNTSPYVSTAITSRTPVYTASWGNVFGITTKTANNSYYGSTVSPVKYDSAEDLSGGAISTSFPATTVGGNTNISGFVYFSPILYPTLTGTSKLSILNYSKNIMRTDRLPSSDYIDSGNVNGSVSLLQQNLGFASYIYDEGTTNFTIPGYANGAQQIPPDISNQEAELNVLDTLGSCENLVGLGCYQGDGVTFGINPNCPNSDAVEGGCYVFVTDPLNGIGTDITNFSEWSYRFRFFYGLCRGVLAQTFTNNWVNGSLFAYPIQVDTYYNSQNQPLPPIFAKELVYFDSKTNNFYYRSSPFLSGTTQQLFIGRPTSGLIKPTNDRNLLYPTTIVNLGMKDDFYQEISFDASAKAYIMGSLNPTSYSDTSDLVNLFVISRIANSSFLQQLFSFGNNGLNLLFGRPELRIDGDLAQSMSINSEFGVIPFSPEFYSSGSVGDPVVILGSGDNPTMGVFFSSTTFDLQNKDYLTPGVIDFRPNNTLNAITYPYGIKSQFVPFYQWELNQPSNQNIFGSQLNNWKTNYNVNPSSSGIFGFNYQSLDRRNLNPPTYFVGSNNTSDLYQRGYIFNVDSNGGYSFSMLGIPLNKFLVSAPFHFYFGIVKGNSALDKFKTKYSIGE